VCPFTCLDETIDIVRSNPYVHIQQCRLRAIFGLAWTTRHSSSGKDHYRRAQWCTLLPTSQPKRQAKKKREWYRGSAHRIIFIHQACRARPLMKNMFENISRRRRRTMTTLVERRPAFAQTPPLARPQPPAPWSGSRPCPKRLECHRRPQHLYRHYRDAAVVVVFVAGR
jgi:hypothetical protein